MYVHTYIHTQTYILTYIHTYTNIYTYIHTYVRTYVHTYIRTYVRSNIPTYIHIHTYIHTCMHAYIHIYVHTYIHTYVHTYVHRAGLSTFGALGKFNLSGPQKLFMQKLAILPIIGQFTCISYTCMHACKISTLFVKGMVSYCYCVHAAVSAGYPIT